MPRKKTNAVKSFAVEFLTPKSKRQQKRDRPSLKAFLIELVVFAALVAGYFFLVLIFLDRWLKGLFDHNKVLYAMVALGLIAGQGVVLEVISALLMKLVHSKID